MFNFFKNFKTNALLVANMVISSTMLLYLVSLFGFDHLNKEFINSTFIAIAFGVLLITIIIGIISFILYVSFKTTYKKFSSTLDTVTKKLDEAIENRNI